MTKTACSALWIALGMTVLGVPFGPPGCALIAGVEDGELAPTASGGAGVGGTTMGGGGTSAGGGGSGGGGTGGTSTGGGATGGGGAGPQGYADLVMADGAIAYWRLGEEVGPTAYDSSGNDHHGTYIGATITLGVDGALAGDPDTAAHFAGTSQGLINMGDVASLDFIGRAEFSFELWALPDLLDGAIASKATYVDGTGYVGFSFLIPGGNSEIYFRRNNVRNTAPLSLPTDWLHLVGTYDGYVIRLYVNGELVDTDDATDDVADLDAPFRIGETDNWGRYDGAVDEVAVYDYQLLPSQITAHYDAGVGR